MNIWNSLAIKIDESEKLIEAKFGRNGFLFLVSAQNKFLLVDNLNDRNLVYAVFIRRLWRLVGLALHEAVFWENGKKVAMLNSGSLVIIGRRKLHVFSKKQNEFWSRIFRAKNFLVIILILSVFVFASGLFKLVRSPQKEILVETKTENKNANGYSDRLIEEARDYLKKGETAQAKLSLLEASELEPSNDDVKNLLKEIAQDNDEFFRKKQAKQNSGSYFKTEELFKEGLDLKNKGDFAGAKAKLDQAVKRINKEPLALSFSPSLEDARNIVTENLKITMWPKFQKADGILKSVSEENPGEAVEQLILAKVYMDEFVRVLPDDESAASLKNDIYEKIGQISNKWLSGAFAAEKFLGCAKAVPMYKKIATKLGDVQYDVAKDAQDGLNRCGQLKQK